MLARTKKRVVVVKNLLSGNDDLVEHPNPSKGPDSPDSPREPMESEFGRGGPPQTANDATRDERLQDQTPSERDLDLFNKHHYAQIEQYKDENAHLLMQTRKQEEELIYLRNKVKASDMLRMDFERIQNDHFQRVATDNWTTIETSVIEQRLEKLRESIEEFGREASIDEFQQARIYTVKDSKRLGQALADFVQFDGHDLDVRQELMATKKAPMLCLTGLLSAKICFDFFENPFFFMTTDYMACLDKIASREANDTGVSGYMDPTALVTLYKTFLQVDEASAHKWRAETLRFLTFTPNSDGIREQLHHATRQYRDKLCEQKAKRFLNGPARFLVRSNLSDQERSNLVAVFKQAGSFAAQLHTQRTSVRCFFLDDLRQSAELVKRESLLWAHNLHRYDYPGKIAQDPGSVKVVVHPAFIGYGTNEGTLYDVPQRWSKAVVWLNSSRAVEPAGEVKRQAALKGPG